MIWFNLAFGVIGLILFIWILTRRRVVTTDVVHIVQRRKATVSYGVGCKKNVYYEWPSWLPIIGVTVRRLPITNFDLSIDNYPAYDKDRIPFIVDIKAFFRIVDTNVAASRVKDFRDLERQLLSIIQGTVRSILAKSKLEEIMEERNVYGQQFTENVKDNLREWGIESIKNIELMDVRDAEGSNVIENVMAKQKSAIEKESRVVVAENKKIAAEAEILANQSIEVKKAEANAKAGKAQAESEQMIGIAQAESEKAKGIAEEQAQQAIREEAKTTAEKEMAVQKVNQVKLAEIEKEAALVLAEQQKKQMEIEAEAKQKQMQINADAKKYEIENIAKANLEAEKNKAEAIKTVGNSEAEIVKAKALAEAEGEKQKQLASVVAQTTLAKDIGENEGYQNYLIKIKEVEVSMQVGIAQAEAYGKALEKADLKILANTGDVQSGIGKITDLLTAKGGSALVGLGEALKQSDSGEKLLNGILGKLTTPKGDQV